MDLRPGASHLRNLCSSAARRAEGLWYSHKTDKAISRICACMVKSDAKFMKINGTNMLLVAAR